MKKRLKTRRKIIEYRRKCPRCHRELLIVKTTYRLNYPYGKKSKARRTIIKKVEMCLRCNYKK